MNFKEWLKVNNRGIVSRMAGADDFPDHGGFGTYSEYVKRVRPAKWQAMLRAWLDFAAEKREKRIS